MDFSINRRHLIRSVASSAGAITFSNAIGNVFAHASESREADDHFLIHIDVAGGFDPNYTFDARPLEMTHAKLQTNYSGLEPEKYIGKNNTETWITKGVSALKPHLDRFSIINGALMLTNFDGHGENQSYMLTGNAFGGESYQPYLNHQSQFPLDAIQIGSGFFAELSNIANVVPLTPQSAASLTERIKKMPNLDPKNSMIEFVNKRFASNAKDAGKFGNASSKTLLTMEQVPNLVKSLTNLKLNFKDKKSIAADPDLDAANLIGQIFTAKIAKSASISLSLASQVDSHDVESAKKYPALAAEYAEKLAKIIQHFKMTAFDEKRSLLDVTTIFVTSEMGRSMRSFDDMEKSGTDHNPYRNSILIGGKGIRGGMVVGATDFQTSKEELSPAHLSFDKSKRLIMGRPFDVATMKSRADLPEIYKAENYLNYLSITNSLFKIFGIPEEKYWAIERNGPKAPTLDGLLT